jgi:ATP synthase protein I
MNDTPDPEQLKALEAKIKAAKAAIEPAPRRESKYEKASLAWRMVLELVIGMAMGMGIGYGLDRLFGTIPIFLILFSLLGFGAGIRVMMRTAEEVKRQKVARSTKD